MFAAVRPVDPMAVAAAVVVAVPLPVPGTETCPGCIAIAAGIASLKRGTAVVLATDGVELLDAADAVDAAPEPSVEYLESVPVATATLDIDDACALCLSCSL